MDGSYLNGSTRPYSECDASNGLFRSYYDYQDNSMPYITDYGTRDGIRRPNAQFVFEVCVFVFI